MSEVTVDAGVAGAVHTPVEQDTAMETTGEASPEPGSEPQEPEQSISRSPSSDSHVRLSVSDSQVCRYPSRHRKPRERFEPGILWLLHMPMFFFGCVCFPIAWYLLHLSVSISFILRREECHRLSIITCDVTFTLPISGYVYVYK